MTRAGWVLLGLALVLATLLWAATGTPVAPCSTDTECGCVDDCLD